jgi:hypothetical protein
MQLRAIFDARGVLRVTVGLTAAYVLAIALFVYTGDGDPSFRVAALGFFEALFGTPLMIACGLAIWLNSVQARRILLGFAVGYIIFTLAVFYSTFTGEHDAQYQLLLFQIPMIGFPALLIVGVIAGFFGRAPRR